MKKKLIIILTVLLTFGLSFTGCDKPEKFDDNLNGTWVHESGLEITFDDGSFTEAIPINGNLVDYLRGTYTTYGREIIISTTHINGSVPNGFAGIEGKWYTADEYTALAKNSGTVDDLIELHYNITVSTGSYSVKGNTLTIIGKSESKIFSTVYKKK